MESNREDLYERCKRALYTARDECVKEINRLKGALSGEITGDDADISQTLEYQEKSLRQKDKLELQLEEIDDALERLDDGSYGVCEETGDDIEERRLLTIPWTRFSAEGAEIRERRARHYATPAGAGGGAAEDLFLEESPEED